MKSIWRSAFAVAALGCACSGSPNKESKRTSGEGTGGSPSDNGLHYGSDAIAKDSGPSAPSTADSDAAPASNRAAGSSTAAGTNAAAATAPSAATGAGGASAEIYLCLAAKADNYNILITLDNTGSQAFTDPTDARSVSAQSFVDQWEGFVASHPSARVNMAVTSFNTQSIRSAYAWIQLDGAAATGDKLKSEIASATMNPNGGTAYSPALQDAASFFQQINAQPDADRQRNYLVFMTDGVPNAAEAALGGTSGVAAVDAALPAMRQNPPDCEGMSGCDDTSFDAVLVEHMADIPAAVSNLVQTYGVAIYAIASGTGVPAAGEPIVKYLAQPTTGIKFPDQVGHYFRAASASEISGVFSSVFATVGTCN